MQAHVWYTQHMLNLWPFCTVFVIIKILFFITTDSKYPPKSKDSSVDKGPVSQDVLIPQSILMKFYNVAVGQSENTKCWSQYWSQK